MVALDDVGATFLQACHDVVGEFILENAVAETQQLIDIPHRLQGQVEALEVAVEV